MMLIRRTPILTGLAVLLVGGLASAQEVKAEATAEVAAPEETTSTVAAPEPAAEPAAVEPAPVGETVVVDAVVVEDEAAEDATSGLSYTLFGDAYATFSTAQPGSGAQYHRAYTANQGLNQDGFSLAWVGLDLAYDGGKIGVTTSIRAGSAVNSYFVDSRMFGPVSITQGFVTWKPIDALAIDVGMFGTIFGAEVAENWYNFNYTRGAVYYGYQPFWHTGARVSYALTDKLTLKGFLADDANQISLLTAGGANSTMQAAAQLAYSDGGFTGAVGTMQTLGEGALSGFDRFVDLVLGYSTDKFGVLFNGDFNVNDTANSSYLALSAAARYYFVPAFGVALRGEFIKPNMDVSNNEIVTATLTLDFKPVAGADNLLIRWDNRVESMSAGGVPMGQNPLFDRDGAPTDAWFESTIGLVAYTSGML